VNIDHAKPELTVPVRTGIASSTAAASENGVSLFQSIPRSGFGEPVSESFQPLTSLYQTADIPFEPTVTRRRKNCPVRAMTVEGIRAATQVRRAVRLCACPVAYRTHRIAKRKSNDNVRRG
jgi:hypothetical protein